MTRVLCFLRVPLRLPSSYFARRAALQGQGLCNGHRARCRDWTSGTPPGECDALLFLRALAHRLPISSHLDLSVAPPECHAQRAPMRSDLTKRLKILMLTNVRRNPALTFFRTPRKLSLTIAVTSFFFLQNVAWLLAPEVCEPKLGLFPNQLPQFIPRPLVDSQESTCSRPASRTLYPGIRQATQLPRIATLVRSTITATVHHSHHRSTITRHGLPQPPTSCIAPSPSLIPLTPTFENNRSDTIPIRRGDLLGEIGLLSLGCTDLR